MVIAVYKLQKNKNDNLDKGLIMRISKVLCLFYLTVVMGIFPQFTYAGEEVAKAPHEDSKVIELNNGRTINELKKITKGEFEEYISGRSPVSIDTPRDINADSRKGINDMNRGIKKRSFRAPAIPRPDSITISEGI